MSHAALGFQMQVGCFYWRKKACNLYYFESKMCSKVAFIEGFRLFVKRLFYESY